MGNRLYATLTARLMASCYVDTQTPILNGSHCWTWKGATCRGYGYISLRLPGRIHPVGCRAHRVAYQQMVGPIPDAHEIDHLCVNAGCINPAHLEPVTSAENVRRRDDRIRQALEELERASASLSAFSQAGDPFSEALADSSVCPF